MGDMDLKLSIQSAIKDFSVKPLTEASINLFNTLGYNTQRQNPLDEKTYSFFKDSFLFSISGFNESKAMVSEWKSIDLLFQLTGAELAGQTDLFDTGKVKWKGEDKETVIETYLFFALELANESYSRSALARITREINKVFPMPVMILFRCGGALTLSVINRRLSKKDAGKDVLEKVTLIKDISVSNPHRAHVEILFDLSLDELKKTYKFTGFVELHNAWQKTLDTKELNKRFYKDLSNWYFWAVKNVSFPNDADADADKSDEIHNAESMIRLLTRLIFIWFIKEKNLIPDVIFDDTELPKLIKGFNTPGSSVYYRAVLQNLFFATLNQKIEERSFAADGSFDENKKNYGIKNLYRYSQDFKISKEEVIKLFKSVPFLNGGLFDCLDAEDKNGKVLYLDGFSRNPKKQAVLPDEIFFSGEKTIDLSEVYDDKKKKNEKVKGLFEIFNHYKFTITENTPIEEEVALDPELLGRVFENLLASYNPETKTTARKQTGSFYTPREIVNFMVDESLKVYLSQNLEKDAKMNKEDADAGLDFLLGYNEKEHLFDEKQTPVLINAIDDCKILDPACGSGAFPMGILHKMVHILHKLDPDNTKWKEKQTHKILHETEETFKLGSKVDREERLIEINNSFDQSMNNPDYARKLYLVENCIYGVDIQSIAAQISKLRFFISLIVDQKPDRERENYGIRPLPNLETKFVAANSLIGIKKPEKQYHLFDNESVNELEEKLKSVRHWLFSAKTPAVKRRLREEDHNLREVMGKILEDAGWSNESARMLASWDPYNQNESSSWFDPEWMFGITDGFDIVIGNPPYVQLQKLRGNPLQKAYRAQNYKVHDANGDIYCLFYEAGINFLDNNGVLCYITSNKWMRAGYGEKLRQYFSSHNPLILIDLGPGVFESATVDTNIMITGKGKNTNQLKGVSISNINTDKTDISFILKTNGVTLSGLGKESWYIGNEAEQNLKEKIEKAGRPLKEWDVKIYRGVLTGLNEAFIIDTPTKEKLCAEDPRSAEIIKPILRGRDIKRYGYEWAGLWILATGFDIDVPKKYPAVYKHLLQFKDKAIKRDDQGLKWWNLRSCAYYAEFEKEKVVWGNLCLKTQLTLVPEGMFINAPSPMLTPAYNYHLAVINSTLGDYYIRLLGVTRNGGYFEYKPMFVEKLPIPPITASNKPAVDKIESLVDKILAMKKLDSGADTSREEKEIDSLVYQLYSLTPEEIAVIEGINIIQGNIKVDKS